VRLVWWLENLTGEPVLDQTGLTGKYRIAVKIPRPPPGSTVAHGAPIDDQSLFSAITDQLGLELRPARVLVQEFVILSARQPAPN